MDILSFFHHFNRNIHFNTAERSCKIIFLLYKMEGIMERFAWKARLLPGKKEEYIRRHDEVWPEMTELLNKAGIHNYSIWLVEDELIGYYEAEKGAEFASRTQAESPIVDKWNEYMKDVMVMEKDPKTGTHYQLQQVFFHP
jgi:L-rhamnose mutarotase